MPGNSFRDSSKAQSLLALLLAIANWDELKNGKPTAGELKKNLSYGLSLHGQILKHGLCGTWQVR